MFVDLHVHTTRKSSDSSLSPTELIQEAKRIGLDGVCLTEHGGPWDRHEFQRFAEQHDLLLVRAMEVETDMGHITVFGLDGYRSGINKARELRRCVDEVGGFMVVAHPFRGLFNVPESRNLLYSNGLAPSGPEEAMEHPVFGLVDAVEVANAGNSDQENRFALRVAELLGKPCVGGSDAHSVHGLGGCLTVFEDTVRSEEEFVEALRSGRFHAAMDLHIGALRPFMYQLSP